MQLSYNKSMIKLNKTIEYLFYLFVFLLPWQTRWFWHIGQLGGQTSQYLSFSLYATEVLFFIIIFLAVIIRLKNKDYETAVLNLKILDFYIVIFLFFIVAIFTLFFAQDKQVAFYYLLKFLEGFATLILIINFRISYKKIGWAVFLAAIIQSGLGIYQSLVQKVFASKWLGMAVQNQQDAGVSVVETASQRFLRAYGALPHPNILAGFLAVSIVVTITLILLSRSNKEKLILNIGLAIISAGLFLTFSKSAFLALIIGLVFMSAFILLSKERETKIYLGQSLVLILVIMAILSLLFQAPLVSRLKGDNRLEQYSTDQRANYMQQAQDIIKNNWLKGVGLGNYTLAVYNAAQIKEEARFYQPVHNVYLLAAAELGILGFVFYILLIILAIKELWQFKIEESLQLLPILRNFKINRIFTFYQRRFFWFLSYTAIFIMLLIIMVFDHYFWTLYFGIIFWWLMFGLWLKQVSLMK